jgi:hypothetical protein
VLFASRVQVRTEVMLEAEDGLVGTMRADPIDERGSREFSEHYNEIAATHAHFAQLQVLFDLTLMAGLLREHVPAQSQLRRLANRSASSVSIRDDDYPVLRNGGTPDQPFMTGGVDLAFDVPDRALDAMRGSLGANINEILASRPLEANQSPGNASFTAGLEEFWTGSAALEKSELDKAVEHFQAAERELTAAIAADDDLTGAYLVRGFIRIQFGLDIDGGVRDCQRVLRHQPNLVRPYAYLALAELKKATSEQDRARRIDGFARSRELADTALARDSNDAQTWSIRGQSQMLSANLGPFWDYEPDGVRARLATGSAREIVAEAARDFDEAVRREEHLSSRTQWLIMRGTARMMSGDLDGARADLSGDEIGSSAAGLAIRGVVAFAAGELDAANDAANQSLGRADNDDAHRLRAAVRFNRRDIPGALEDLRAIKNPDQVTQQLIQDLQE